MKLKRAISALLVFCMLLTMFSADFNYVLAAEDTGMADMDALAALGIDTSKVPEGYNENDTSNPYGKDTVTMNPVSELYVVGLNNKTSILPSKETVKDEDPATKESTKEIPNSLKGKIYGHEDITSKTTGSIMQKNKEVAIASGTTSAHGKYVKMGGINSGYYLQPENYKITTTLSGTSTGTFKIASSKTAGGNFDGNKEGKAVQNVLLYTGENSENGGLNMRIGDTYTGDSNGGKYGGAIELIPTTKSIGNPSGLITYVTDDGLAEVTENFATDPYLIQNYLQVTTGDYDGDGTDEIAVYIPELNGSRIVVYKLKSITNPDDEYYKEAGNWQVAWTYSLKETGYVSNMVSLVSGDFNKDGTADLAAAWGYYYGPDNNKGSKAVVMFGSKGKMLQSSQEFDLTFDNTKYGKSDIVRASFTLGDLTGSGEELLVLGGQSDDDIKHGNLNSRYVAIYTWNGKTFESNISQNFDLFEKDSNGNLVNSNMFINNGNYYSSPLCPANLAVIKQGLNETPYLYLDSLQIQYGDKGLEIIRPLDQFGHNAGNTAYYVEYGAVSGDMTGLGYETMVTMQQTLSSVETVGSPTVHYYYKNWFYKLLGIKTFYVTGESCFMFTPGKTYMTVLDFSKANPYAIKTETDTSTSICMQNTDNDTSYMQYTGTHYFTYSDPKVLAVLASPPYFSDLLGRDDLSGNYGESTTSYSSTTGEGSGDTFSTTIEAGVYVSFEQSISVFGVEIASVEAEASVAAGFTYETETTSSLEQTVSYSATSGEDMIAFFSIPLEIYEYTAYTSNGDGTYTKQAMTVNIPRTAAVQVLTLDSYEDIAKDYDILPQISGTILSHTPGDPASYSSGESGYLKPIVYGGDWARVGYSGTEGGAGISQEIAMSKETTNSYNIYGKIDTKAGAGAGGVKVGVTVGAEIGGGWVNITTAGNSFSGELQNMPVEAEEYGYSHVWKIFSYLYDDGRVSFPVVNYLVKDVVTPPALPTDFAQNVGKTTDTQIALEWTYDKMVAGFQLYRYYEFPDGSGSYELKFVPMTDGIYDAGDGLYHFEFIDKNLNPYQDYDYQIQTVRASVPNNSIPSEVLTVRTKTDVGYPEYEIQGLDVDGYLRIYPDSESAVKVIVTNAEDYPNGISYQWQKSINGVWVNINGRTANELKFKSSGAADQAAYRCRTNLMYFDEGRGNEYYISAYSPEFSTLYSKRTPLAVEDSFKAAPFKMDGGGNALKLNIDLVSGNTNHYDAPTGNVTFTVKGTDYDVDYTIDLKKSTSPISSGDNKGKYTSKATVDVKNLPDGIYEISAYYGGSRVFKSLTTPESITALIGENGYQLVLNKGDKQSAAYTYGDYITPIVKKIEKIDGTITTTTTSAGITYHLDNNTSEVELTDGKFRTPSVGSYTLKAKYNDSVLVERAFTVSQRDITVKASDKNDVGKGYVSINPPELALLSSTMAFNEKLVDLSLGIIATNSAGNVITLDDSTEPGNYTIIGSTTTNTDPAVYNNYNVAFLPGTYTIIGEKYDVTIAAEKYQGRDVGTITLSNSSDGKGAEFSAGTQLMFFAAPYTGYVVDYWTIVRTDDDVPIAIEDSQLNASKTRLTYTMKSEPITVTVKFKIAETRLNTAKTGEGTITWDDPSFTDGAIVKSGAQIDFKAVAAQGYTFKEWRIETGGNTTLRTGNPNSDGSNTLNFTMGNLITTVRAVFERDSYTITLSDNLEAVYKFFDDQLGKDVERVVHSGAKIAGDTNVLVRIKAGYTAAEDAVWKVNGEVTDVPAGGYSFIMKENTSVSVDTVQQTYTISTEAYNGTITVKIGNDEPMVSDEEIKDVPGGSKVVFTAVPAHGYAFAGFEIEGTDKYTQNDNVLIISELGADIEVTAEFTKSTDYTVEVNCGGRAAVNYVLYDPMGNEVRRDVADSGSGIEVSSGDRLTLTVTPDAGFMVDKWTIDGTVYDTNSRSRDLVNIDKNIIASVDVISQISYTVNYEAEGGGTIVSATSDGLPFVSGEIDVGGSTEVIIASEPDIDRMVEKWTINDKLVQNEDGVPFVGKVLTIESLTSDKPTIDIKVYFTEHKEYTVEYNENNADIDGEFTPDDASAGNVREGAKAVFTVTPHTGYRITAADIDVENFAVIKNPGDPEDQYGTWTLVIDKVESNLTVTASAMKIYSITIDDVYGGKFGSITETTYPEQAIEGEKVILHQYADLDRTFVKWDVRDENNDPIDIAYTDGEFSFIMPESDVTVSGEFKNISTVDIEIEVYDINSEAEGGYNGTFSAQINRDGLSGYPEVFASTATSVAITGVNRGYRDEYVSWQAPRLIITAAPDADYRVLKWKVNGVTYTSPLDFPVPSNSMSEFIMDVIDAKNLDIVIQFEQIGERITYGVDGSNGKILSATNKATGNEFISGNTVSSPADISFKAQANAGYEIEAWLVNGDVAKYGNFETFLYEADGIHGADIKVKFARVPFTVSYGGANGKVTSEQVANGKTVRGDTSVTFTAEANPGYKFDKFNIMGNSTTVSTSNPMTIKITGDTNVAASFAPFANCTINYSVTGGNGKLTASKNGAPFVGGGLAAGNDSIVLTAVPNANYKVKEWVVDGKAVKASETYTLEVSSTVHNISVEFERSHYVINFSAEGSGTVSAVSGGNPVDRGAGLLKGSDVTFSAVPNAGFQVAAWQLNGTDLSGTKEKTTYTLRNITADTKITVVFEPIPEYTITIVKTGTGEGIVKAYVNGVEKQIVNNTITVKNHDKVMLVAVPKDEYNNASWTVSGVSFNSDGTNVTMADVVSNAVATVRFGTAELITVEAYVRTEDSEPAKGKLTVKAGYPDAMEPLNAVGTTVNVTKGKTVQFTAVPDEGYRVKYWVINDVVAPEYGNTITRITETNIKAEVYFELALYYRVPVSTEDYTITVTERLPDEPEDDRNSVMKGGSVTFTLSPNNGAYFKHLMISGVNCLTQTGSPEGTTENIVTSVKNNNTYTVKVENVTSDIEHGIVTALPVVTIKNTDNGTITAAYTDSNSQKVTVSSGDKVPVGAELTVTAAPDNGYKLSEWGDFAKGKSGTSIKLTVPQNDITISAAFIVSGGGGGTPGGGGGGGSTPPVAIYSIGTKAGYGGSITPESATVEAGGSATFAITTMEGFAIKDVLVNGKSVGAVSSYTFSNVDSDSSIEAIFMQKLAASGFIDVNDSDWFAEAVEYVVSLGLFKGTSEDAFSPYMSMTRGMFVTVLGRLHEYMNSVSIGAPEEIIFTDVSLDKYYAAGVKWASDNNIITGYENGEFRPEEPITREQIVAIMYRFAVYAGLDTTKTSDITVFADGGETSQWAAEAMRWAVGSGIIGGRPNGTIDPQGLVQRCEVAAILQRFINSIE